ncbi:MAG: N-6 DNA methylase [Desulfatiglans sp.]|nr:N-6 DNA methylase [Desulfatiglans sp.]
MAQEPVDIKKPETWDKLKTLEILRDVAEVSRKLQDFHRDNIESGKLFGDKRFGDLNNRADKAIIRDLKTVRRELIDAGLKDNLIKFAHALIGRSIFIRYLEDRGILTENYFLKIARQKSGWTDFLKNPISRAGIDFSENNTFYPRVLSNKDFTYEVFKKLSKDFNGDMFPNVEEEEKKVTQKHLELIQGLLYGDAGIQKKLFFYSYNFDIIPLDLISSIYEEFYHPTTNADEKKKKVREDGAYYTPSVLAEFVVSRVLTPDVLAKNPRVLDPACGSGIFLVEAFRRIVRYQWHKLKRPLTFDELKDILKNQIAGIEANEEAARITAFSLYLAMLHYLDPPAIDQQIKMGNKLPNLIASTSASKNHFHCILPKNAFDTKVIDSCPIWKERFGKECVDVVVGNPPWGAPGTNADRETKTRHEIQLDWCKSNKKPIGDKESSQAFLWRALDFLKQDGIAGMLVSAGVMFKHNPPTQTFREKWMKHCSIHEVFNFSHVRQFFFKGAVSPFLALCFRNKTWNDKSVLYGSAKQTITLDKNQVIIFSKYDLHYLHDEDLTSNAVWKIYWFGRVIDNQLQKKLSLYSSLQTIVDRKKSGAGYKIGTQDYDFYKLDSLSHKTFSRYGNLTFEKPPQKAERPRSIHLYTHPRLIIKRGIDEKSDIKGQILACYSDKIFAFSEWFYGIQLLQPQEWLHKIILGSIWSSLSRYFFFMKSSQWGLWYSNIHFVDELLKFPIVIDRNNPATNKIIELVDKLSNYNPAKQDLFSRDSIPEEKIEAQRKEWERQLDEAVFDLYGLNDEQRDLIHDFCKVTLPFFYQPFDSIGAMKAVENDNLSWIKEYINIFCRRWNPYLEDGEEMRAEVYTGAHDNMLAIEFYPTDKGDPHDLKIKKNEWASLLDQIGESLPHPMGVSQIILDGFVNVVSDSGIILIKRNEKRFWTKSLAREDADATICKRMQGTTFEGLRYH